VSAATDKVRRLLTCYRSAMLTTVLGASVHTRPTGCHPKGENFNGSLWWFTDERSRKVQEIKAGATVSFIFQGIA
jgi:general stress protein 26